jgi:hypothetical protein
MQAADYTTQAHQQHHTYQNRHSFHLDSHDASADVGEGEGERRRASVQALVFSAFNQFGILSHAS